MSSLVRRLAPASRARDRSLYVAPVSRHRVLAVSA